MVKCHKIKKCIIYIHLLFSSTSPRGKSRNLIFVFLINIPKIKKKKKKKKKKRRMRWRKSVREVTHVRGGMKDYYKKEIGHEDISELRRSLLCFCSLFCSFSFFFLRLLFSFLIICWGSIHKHPLGKEQINALFHHSFLIPLRNSVFELNTKE